MNKFQTMKDLKEEFGSNVLSSFLILIGAIISIIFGNVTKDLFDTNVSVAIYYSMLCSSFYFHGIRILVSCKNETNC